MAFGRAVRHVVTEQRADRDEREVADLEPARKCAYLLLDTLERLLLAADEAHLVDAHR